MSRLKLVPQWTTILSLKLIDLAEPILIRQGLHGAILRGAILRGATLIGANLRGANLSETYLSETNLSGANLRGANLIGAILIGANLSEANLSEAILREANLSEANLCEATLRKATLREAILRGAILSETNLSEANLRGADLFGANLTGAILIGRDLSGVDLREVDLRRTNLTGTNLTGANLGRVDFRGVDLRGIDLRGVDLTGAILTGANLREVDLRRTNLTGAILREADLTGANLSQLKAIATNFTSANLTGACIEDWHINSETNLTDIICEHIYLRQEQQERRPSDPTVNFALGEFTKLFQKALETVDLIFTGEFSWQSFLSTFQKLQVECGSDELTIQAIENKNDGAFVIRVNVPDDADKAKIENYIYQQYKEAQLKIKSKNEQINLLLNTNMKLIEVVETMAKKENQDKVTMNFNAPVTGAAGNVEGNQIIYTSEQKKTLAEAAAEIQNLLKQLEQNNPTATESEQITHINGETSPNFKRRVASALQAGGETAIDEFILENKYLKVVKAAIKGWLEPDS